MNIASRQQTGQVPTILRPYPLVQDKGMWSLFEGKRHELGSMSGRNIELLPITVAYFGAKDPLTEPVFPTVNYGVLFTSAENWDCSPQRAEAKFNIVYRFMDKFALLETESNAIIRAFRAMRMAEMLLYKLGMSPLNAIAYGDSLALGCKPFTLDQETILMPKSNGQKPKPSRAILDALDTQEYIDKALFERRDGAIPPVFELPRDMFGNDIVPGTFALLMLAEESMSEEQSLRLIEIVLNRPSNISEKEFLEIVQFAASKPAMSEKEFEALLDYLHNL
jgi:hypothetical protein